MSKRKSLGMKYFFSSPPIPDLQNISLSLEIVKKQNRELRQDLIDVKTRLTRIIGILNDSAPVEREEEYPEEEIVTKSDRDRD